MHIRLLGPLEVITDDGSAAALGPLKRRITLAMLALDVGRVVSTDRLIDALWGDEPPRSALATLQGLIYQIRQSLGTEFIESRAPGYRMVASGITVDTHVLASATEGGNIDTLDSALDAVRGRPLDDLGDDEVIDMARRHLDALRLTAFERWCDLAMSAGRMSEVVLRIEREVAENPWRESLWSRLMLALYRSDRQADALGAFTRARRVLVDDLGLEPGPSLRELNQQILEHDSTLSVDPAQSARGPVSGRTKLVSSVATRSIIAGEPILLAGRVGELAHLRGRIDGANGSLSMVIGEPGIGKTRLVTELAKDAAAGGALVLWGRCPDGDWAPPYAPFIEAFERLLRALDVDQARSLIDSNAGPLANVLPIVSELFTDLVDPRETEHVASIDASELRYQILQSISDLLRSICLEQPVILVLDDLHWIDSASAAALSFMIPLTLTAPLHIVGTYRDNEVADAHPLTALLAGAQREVYVDRVRLRGLTPAAARVVIESIEGSPVDEALVHDLVIASGGNPFFLTELARYRLEHTEGTIPESVNDTLRQRLSTLHTDTRTMLRIGALFDGPFPLEVTRLVADLDESAALDALDEAIHAHLIEPTEHFDEYQFVHALTREAARSTINPSRLGRMIRRVADTLVSLQGPLPTDEDLARIASLYHASRALPGAERGITPALTAAAHADELAAHAERADLLQIAVDLMPLDDPRRPRTLADLATARVRSFQTDESIELGLEAAEAISSAEGDEAACIFLTRLVIDMRSTGSWSSRGTWYRWVDRGIEFGAAVQSPSFTYLSTTRHSCRISDLPESSFHERALLFADEEFIRLGRSAMDDGFGRTDRLAIIAAVDNVGEARDVADRCWVNLSEYTGDLRHTIAYTSRQIETCRRHRQIGALVEDLSGLASALACLGDIVAARTHLDEAIAIEQSLPPYAGRIFQVTTADLVVTGITDGPWDEHIARVNGLMSRWSTAAELLQDERNRIVLEHENPAMMPRRTTAVAMVHARRGRVDKALGQVESLVPYLWDASVREQSYTQVAYAIAEVIWLAGGSRFSGEVKAAIQKRWLPCDFRYFWTDVRVALGRLCSVDGDVAEGAQWFEQAREVFAEEGARALSAIVDHDEAWMYIRNPHSADDTTILALLDRSIAQFREIGMPGWLTRSEHLRHELLSGQPAQR